MTAEPTDPPSRDDSLRRVALYVGGLLGPFGGGVTAPMLPEIADTFHVSVQTSGLALTAYFVPFAALQLVSGTLGERWGRRRTTAVAYAVYAVASVVCVVAPTAWGFFGGRFVQGAANAFTTPLLVAGLAELVPAARLSRTLGLFAACQAAGQSLAPLVGSAANAVSWRLAFVLVAVVAALLALLPPQGGPRPAAQRPRFRSLLTPRMGLVSAAGFASYAGGAGLPFLVALYAERRFGVSDASVGLVLLGFGVMGILLASTWGEVSERLGAHRASALGLLVGGVGVAAVGSTTSTLALVVVWTLTGAMSSLATVGIQNLAAREVPGNRGGAVSVVSAFRFAGGAVAPLLWLPLYPEVRQGLNDASGSGQARALPVFLAAGAVSLLGAVAAAALGRVRRPPAHPGDNAGKAGNAGKAETAGGDSPTGPPLSPSAPPAGGPPPTPPGPCPPA